MPPPPDRPDEDAQEGQAAGPLPEAPEATAIAPRRRIAGLAQHLALPNGLRRPGPPLEAQGRCPREARRGGRAPAPGPAAPGLAGALPLCGLRPRPGG